MICDCLDGAKRNIACSAGHQNLGKETCLSFLSFVLIDITVIVDRSLKNPSSFLSFLSFCLCYLLDVRNQKCNDCHKEHLQRALLLITTVGYDFHECFWGGGLITKLR